MTKMMVTVMACAAMAVGAGFQVQGNMSEAWDRHSLVVRTGEEAAKLWFTIPAHSGITVVVKRDTGAARTARLNMPGSVDLEPGADYTISMTRDSGAGQWICKDVAGTPVLHKFTTSVDVKRTARLTYVADEDFETWTLSWPKEATFIVRQVSAGGKAVEEQDLSDEDKVELVGGGTFTIEVLPTEGEGEFTAEKED